MIKTSTGATAILDNVDANQLQNLVINTANGQSITQNTAVTLTLPPTSLAQTQAGLIMFGIGSALQFSQNAGGPH